MSDTILASRLSHQVYPMREAPKQGWLEQRTRAVWDKNRHRLSTRQQRLDRFVAAVERFCEPHQALANVAIGRRAGELRGQILESGISDAALAEIFSLVRESAGRALGMRHYSEQLIGGWIMFHGMVAEMETGQGKTLTATLPAAAAALSGLPVHIITVNEYLAQRDAELLAPLYQMLGLSVAVTTHEMSAAEKRAAYASDVTYCTNKQIAFDHLRDRMAMGNSGGSTQLRLEKFYSSAPRAEQLLLPGLCFAIVDEADSVLVDEAVTPLIISRNLPTGDRKTIYMAALAMARSLAAGEHYVIHDNIGLILLTPEGKTELEGQAGRRGGIWRDTSTRQELVVQALKSLHLFERDVEYLVADGKVQIIDGFTGRVMADRTWEQGLHQMIELKEGVELTADRETIARISYQRFFQRYLNLSGMTGTAREIRQELWTVYGLQVFRVPPAQTLRRSHTGSRLCVTQDEKWARVLDQVLDIHATGQPILVGTRSVQASETLSELFRQHKLEHQLLNARQDKAEADIIAQAGHSGRITIATNMAGRGTDIKLGDGVAELGGLYVLATERHESRRIDRQLYGRCGRQGDPGTVAVIESLEDEILQANIPGLLRRLIAVGGQGRVAKALLTTAQLVVERRHYNSRRGVMRADEYFSNALSFTGHME